MVSRKIYYKNKGMENEDYAFLDYDEDSGEFSVRVGYSYKDSDSISWSGNENIYDVGEFISEHPNYEDKVNGLVSGIENEYGE